MATRLKEDERNERIIRGLLKLPENKRCINCNSLGPQYVCTSFWTFVCTNCSGIHREFTHRVKSISMAKFTSQEVSALQGGGNQRAKETYFKGWDPQRQSLPDSSNVDRLRDFIRHVYVDRRYTEERNYDKPPRAKMGDKEEFYNNRNQSGSSPGSRSPGYEAGIRQYGKYRKSPSRPEVVNDWCREDRFANGKKFGDLIDEETKLEGKSPERAKDMGSSSPPLGRPVREILSENAVPPYTSEPPKVNGAKAADGSVIKQRTASSSSLASMNEQVVKSERTVSLIDFDADPEPPFAQPAATTPAQQTPMLSQPVAQPTASENVNWAAFDVSLDTKASKFPSNMNTLDSLLSELSVPAQVANQISGASSGPSVSLMTTELPGGANPTVALGGHNVAPYEPLGCGNSFVKVESGHWSNVQHQQQPSLFPTVNGPSNIQQNTIPANGSPSNQPWHTPLASHAQGPVSAPSMQLRQTVSKPFEEVTPGIAQPSSVEVKSSARKELPENLFTATYPSFPAPLPGWHAGLPRGVGFNMPHNVATLPLPTFPQPKSSNPFDLGSDLPSQTEAFPSMAALQGTLPNVAASPTWMPSQSLPNSLGLPSQASGFASATSPSYMSSQTPGSLSPFSHPSSFSNNGVSLGIINTDQQLAGAFSNPTNPLPYSSVGGNPFG